MALTPRQKNSLLWAYRGSGLPPSLGKSIASQTAANPLLRQQASGIKKQEEQRATLLAGAIKAGALKPEQLTQQDLALAGPKLKKPKSDDFHGGFLSDVGDFLGNLGEDVWDFTKGIPGGIAETGKAVGTDVLNVFSPGFQQGGTTGIVAKDRPSQVKEKVIDPTLESYAYTYLGKGAPKGSTLLGRVAEHPLGPLLDAATIASLGTGGAIRGASALNTAGKGGKPVEFLARAGSTEGRPSLTLNPGQQERAGVGWPEIPQRYSSRPLMKGAQILWDKAASHVEPMQNFSTGRATKRLQRMSHATGMSAEAAAVRAAVKPLVGSRKDLSFEESVALDYALRGWNTPEKIAASKQMFQDSLDGKMPEGANASDFSGMFKTPEDGQKFVQFKANLSPEIEQLILNPTDAMINAAVVSKEAADEGFGKLDLDDEEITRRVNESQQILNDYMMGRGQEPPDADTPVEPDPVGPYPGYDPNNHVPISESDPELAAELDAERDYWEGDDTPVDDFPDLTGLKDQANVPEIPDTPEGFFDEWADPNDPNAPDTIPESWMPEAVDEGLPPNERQIRYHLTNPENSESIGNEGLIPQIGDRSAAFGQDEGIFTYKDVEGFDKDRDGPEFTDPEGTMFGMGENPDVWAIDTTGLKGHDDPEGMNDQYPDDQLYYTDRIPPDRLYRVGSLWDRDQWAPQETWFGGTPNVPNEPPPTAFEFGAPEGYPIEPTYTPNIPAAGFQAQTSGRLARMFGDPPELTFGRGKRERQSSTTGMTAQNMFAEAPQSYLRERPEVLMSGAARIDPKAFVESVARREKDMIAQGFNMDILNKLAVKDKEGEPLRFTNQEQVQKELGNDWVLVNEQFPLQWFSAETNVLQSTIQRIEEMRSQGMDLDSPDVDALLNTLADNHAQEFVKSAFNAQKLDGVAIPRTFFNYQRRLLTATDPFDNAAGRVYSRYMHRWRALTLAYMPRWALNTAIGSFALNMLKGVTPRDYMVARRLHKEGVFGEPRLGGVELGAITGLEYLEPALQGNLTRTTGVGITPMGERIVEAVQRIEDHFRRASFIHSLDKVTQRRMGTLGQVITNLEKRRYSIYDKYAIAPGVDQDILDEALDDPDIVQESIDDLNTFAYNYAALGPYERRYVRMAIPFWGWYKFISKVAYRLPLEYPGRANILANLGMLGAGYEDEKLGKRPDWLHGILPFGENDEGALKYFSTMGWNPFSSIMNPLSDQGAIEGALGLGQASPPIQALLSAYGLDTMRGGMVPISPEQGVATDYFGQLIDIEKGEETTAAQQAGLRRLVMGLLRSAPQIRMGEQKLAGGRPVYPESIPFLDERAMPTDPKDTSTLSILGQILGVAPKTYNLNGYKKSIKKRVKYAKSRNKSASKRLKKETR